MKLFAENWLQKIDWGQHLLEGALHVLGVVVGFVISYFLLVRRRLNEIRRLRQGESDDVLFQTHYLIPVEGTDEVTLVFRNVGPRMTVNSLYDNLAARDIVRDLGQKTTLVNPILQTSGPIGFEIVNIAMSYVAGVLATSSFERQPWLFVMTSEDRNVVRKRCIRCFLIRPDDLTLFFDWEWCKSKVRVERPWHAFRITALHRIALAWGQEEASAKARDQSEDDVTLEMPLVQQNLEHPRIQRVSIGVYPDEKVIDEPLEVDWGLFMDQLRQMGLRTQADELTQ